MSAAPARQIIQPRGPVDGVFAFFKHDTATLRSIIERFDSNRLQVVLDAIHPLDDARAAIERVASGHARGKVIVRP